MLNVEGKFMLHSENDLGNCIIEATNSIFSYNVFVANKNEWSLICIFFHARWGSFFFFLYQQPLRVLSSFLPLSRQISPQSPPEPTSFVYCLRLSDRRKPQMSFA